MPLYQYLDERTDEIYSLIQGMNDEHVAFAADGHKLRRIWNQVQASIDSKINPFSARDFADKTGRKKGTLGNITDAAAELSEKRRDKEGVDKVKETFYKNWSKKRKGRQHPDFRKNPVIEV